MELPTASLIAGELRPGRGEKRPVVNPADGSAVAVLTDASESDVDDALTAATAAWPEWNARTPMERADVLRDVAARIAASADDLAQIVTTELGKPISEARTEVGGTARFFSYTASLLETQVDEIRYGQRRGEEIWTRRRPHGVVAAIIPWNFPSALVSRKIAPAVAAGNGVVLKADEKTPLSALAVAAILAEVAGLPPGLVNVVCGAGATIGRRMVRSPLAQMVTMTGSGEAGKSILRDAAETVKPVSLELGGNAPFIVLPDADLDRAVADAVFSRYMNCGQVCIANERTFVHRDVYPRFVEAFVAQVAALPVGDPADPATRVGPKISEEELAKTLAGVDRSVAAGATVRLGGRRLTGGDFGRGYWMAPTVLTDVTDDMPAMAEELFGPVAPVAPFDSWEEVTRRANAVRHGLSAYVYTNDLGVAMRASRDLAFGEVYLNRVGPEEVNGFHVGYRESGLGGDDGPHGLDLYSLRQTVYLHAGS